MACRSAAFGIGNAEYAVKSGAVVTWTGIENTPVQNKATSWTLKNDFSSSALAGSASC